MDNLTERINLKIVGHDNEIDKEDKNGAKTMRFFGKVNGDYSISRQLDEKGTIYEYSLHKSDLKDGGTLSIVPCFGKKYVEHLQANEKNTILVDNDILKIA
jgi:hypothetical protein